METPHNILLHSFVSAEQALSNRENEDASLICRSKTLFDPATGEGDCRTRERRRLYRRNRNVTKGRIDRLI